MYDVVIITVSYKTKDKILRMLESLEKDIAASGLNVRPVVIDNASDDGIAETLREKFSGTGCIINKENLGFGAASNLAFKNFDAKYYFIVNPDIVFPTGGGVIAELYKFMEEYPRVGIVAPKLILENGEIQPSCQRFPGFWDQPLYRLEWHKKYGWAKRRVERFLMSDFNHSRVLPVDWATGAAIFIRGEALKDAGMFDERYFLYFEDCDLCRGFWEAGWPVFYKGDVFLHHGHERASAKIPGLKSIFQNKMTRIHLKSWLKYWWKWQKIE